MGTLVVEPLSRDVVESLGSIVVNSLETVPVESLVITVADSLVSIVVESLVATMEDTVVIGTGIGMTVLDATAVDVAPVAAGVVVEAAKAVVSVGVGVIVVVVVSMRPPPRVGTAYGGSKSPNFPHALHGRAHDLTASGATRLGSHRPSGDIVAITEGSIERGQSVPRSLRDSCRVAPCPPGTIVETSSRSRANIGLEAAGPALPSEL